MTAAAEVKRFVEPVLIANADIVLAGRLLAIVPVRHIVAGIYIDRTAYRGLYRPHVGAVFLFGRANTFHFNWSRRMFPEHEETWDVTEPAAGEMLKQALEADHLPYLRTLRTIDDFFVHVHDQRQVMVPLCRYPHIMARVLAAQGKLDEAAAACEEALMVRGRWVEVPEIPQVIEEVLYPLIKSGDRVALGAQLRRWEYQSVKALKLTDYWEPQPYPVELGAGG